MEAGDRINDAVEKRSCSEITQTHSTASTLVSKLYYLIIPNSVYNVKLTRVCKYFVKVVDVTPTGFADGVSLRSIEMPPLRG